MALIDRNPHPSRPERRNQHVCFGSKADIMMRLLALLPLRTFAAIRAGIWLLVYGSTPYRPSLSRYFVCHSSLRDLPVSITCHLTLLAIICLLTGRELHAILVPISREADMAKRPKPVHQMTVGQFEARFTNEEACDRYLVARRWPNGVHCPRCGSTRPYELKTMPFKWECPDCSPKGYRFSNVAGPIFENANKPLREWFRVIHLMLTAKKGISSRQIGRYMGFGSVKTAWYMCHRIRTALVEKDVDKLGGVVEVDETFIGGKSINKHGG